MKISNNDVYLAELEQAYGRTFDQDLLSKFMHPDARAPRVASIPATASPRSGPPAFENLHPQGPEGVQRRNAYGANFAGEEAAKQPSHKGEMPQESRSRGQRIPKDPGPGRPGQKGTAGMHPRRQKCLFPENQGLPGRMRPSCSLFLFFQAGPIIPEGPGPDRSGKMGQPERIRAGKIAFSLKPRFDWTDASQGPLLFVFPAVPCRGSLRVLVRTGRGKRGSQNTSVQAKLTFSQKPEFAWTDAFQLSLLAAFPAGPRTPPMRLVTTVISLRPWCNTPDPRPARPDPITLA